MDTLQRYELIRPILNQEKTPKVVHQETGIPLSTIYWILSRFREGGIKGLENKSHAIHSHPKWLTGKAKSKRWKGAHRTALRLLPPKVLAL